MGSEGLRRHWGGRRTKIRVRAFHRDVHVRHETRWTGASKVALAEQAYQLKARRLSCTVPSASLIAMIAGQYMRLTSGGVVMRRRWQLQAVCVNGAGPWRFRSWLHYTLSEVVSPAYLDVRLIPKRPRWKSAKFGRGKRPAFHAVHQHLDPLTLIERAHISVLPAKSCLAWLHRHFCHIFVTPQLGGEACLRGVFAAFAAKS